MHGHWGVQQPNKLVIVFGPGLMLDQTFPGSKP